MTCEELRPEYGAYALGAAEDPERNEIDAHLGRNCLECTSGVKSAVATVAAMSGGVKDVKPPKHLRKRVVAMVSPASHRKGFLVWFPWAATAALALALVSVALPGRFHRKGPEAGNAARFEEVLGILNDPVTKDVAFGDPAARGRFFVNPSKGVVLVASHLPPLQPGRTFEMWVIPAEGKPIPAGTFAAAGDSTAVHIRQGAVASVSALAISVEPAGGSQQPTTTPFLVTKL
jgi:hypothetical protein